MFSLLLTWLRLLLLRSLVALAASRSTSIHLKPTFFTDDRTT
jgi:hypothetical protein